MSQVIQGSGAKVSERILVVDDEAFVREAIELYFVTEGFDVATAPGGQEALQLLAGQRFDLAILDIVMPRMDGIQLLREIKSNHPEVEVVMASGCGTLETAIEAMRLGAYDYVTKPILNFDEDLLKVVRKALERRRLLAANRRLARDLQEINRELKGTNSELKRHVADLEVLYESGRLIGDARTEDQLFGLVEATLQHQFGIEACLTLTLDNEQWSLQRLVGSDVDTSTDLDVSWLQSESLQADTVSLPIAADPRISSYLRGLNFDESRFQEAHVIPMRARGNLVGVLITLHSQTANQDQLRLLQVLAAQAAAPLELVKAEVKQQ